MITTTTLRVEFDDDDLILLRCLALGMSDAQAGEALRAPRSAYHERRGGNNAVRNRVVNLRRKMGAENRCHMVALAITWGLIRLDSVSGSPLSSTS